MMHFRLVSACLKVARLRPWGRGAAALEISLRPITGVHLALMRPSASDAPCACERGARLQPDKSVLRSKCVRRTCHRLDSKAATVDVGKRVTAE